MKTPALMSLLLLMAIVALAIVRHWRIPNVWVEYPVNPDTLFISLYVLWILVETPIARKDVNTEGKRRWISQLARSMALRRPLRSFLHFGSLLFGVHRALLISSAQVSSSLGSPTGYGRFERWGRSIPTEPARWPNIE